MRLMAGLPGITSSACPTFASKSRTPLAASEVDRVPATEARRICTGVGEAAGGMGSQSWPSALRRPYPRFRNPRKSFQMNSDFPIPPDDDRLSSSIFRNSPCGVEGRQPARRAVPNERIAVGLPVVASKKPFNKLVLEEPRGEGCVRTFRSCFAHSAADLPGVAFADPAELGRSGGFTPRRTFASSCWRPPTSA